MLENVHVSDTRKGVCTHRVAPGEVLHVRQVLCQRGDQPLVGHTHEVGLNASLRHVIELCVMQKVSDTDEMMDSTAFIVKAPQEMGLLPGAQFRVSGCLARRGDRAMRRARSSWVEVTTRNGSSLQPVLVTSSPSPFPSRGSDSKRTASVSTGTLEEGVSDLQEVHEGIINSRENKLSLTIAQTPADRLCAAETADTRRRPRGPQRQTPPETQRKPPLTTMPSSRTPSDPLTIVSLTSRTWRAAATTSGDSSFKRSVTASFRKSSSRLCCCSEETRPLICVVKNVSPLRTRSRALRRPKATQSPASEVKVHLKETDTED